MPCCQWNVNNIERQISFPRSQADHWRFSCFNRYLCIVRLINETSLFISLHRFIYLSIYLYIYIYIFSSYIYIYIYIYIYTCVCVCVCVCVQTDRISDINWNTQKHVHQYIPLVYIFNIFMCVYMNILCKYIFLYTQLYIYIYIYIYIATTIIYMCVCVCVCVCTFL